MPSVELSKETETEYNAELQYGAWQKGVKLGENKLLDEYEEGDYFVRIYVEDPEDENSTLGVEILDKDKKQVKYCDEIENHWDLVNEEVEVAIDQHES